MNSLQQLQDCGQSIWLDYIRRDLIMSGEFQRLVEQDGVHGVTSNPTIFDKAIAAGTAYDDALRLLLAADPDRDALTLFEKLEVEDLQMAADILGPVYDQTKGADGFVSIEVSPRLAYDTAGSIAEARRLWKAVNRPNLMVKIPSTVPGVQAVEILIAEGINVNIADVFARPLRSRSASLPAWPDPRSSLGSLQLIQRAALANLQCWNGSASQRWTV